MPIRVAAVVALVGFLDTSPPQSGRGEIWIADQSGRVVVLDRSGKQIFVKEGLGPIRDVDVLPNGRFLVGGLDKKVREFSRDGTQQWEHTAGEAVYGVRYLPGDCILVGEHTRLVKMKRDGTRVWEYAGGRCPEDLQLLPGGKLLVAWYGSAKAEEVEIEKGAAGWSHAETSLMGAQRLRDGSTLFCNVTSGTPRIESKDGAVTWKFTAGKDTPHAWMAPNGDVLVCTWDSVLRVRRDGTVAWTFKDVKRAIKAREH